MGFFNAINLCFFPNKFNYINAVSLDFVDSQGGEAHGQTVPQRLDANG